LPAVDILLELGRRRMVGGQEDMIVDVALDLLRSREAGPLAAVAAADVASKAMNPASHSIGVRSA
jgi:4-hydroxy 2-oxovalerate aldolase